MNKFANSTIKNYIECKSWYLIKEVKLSKVVDWMFGFKIYPNYITETSSLTHSSNAQWHMRQSHHKLPGIMLSSSLWKGKMSKERYLGHGLLKFTEHLVGSIWYSSKYFAYFWSVFACFDASRGQNV